ncbi:hypothetical protein AB0C52_23695 [Streptomyces sp. NPDC048717]|uniref:hypothetical protein n=1 Tax=Streptomyces sp. NPDC048717 TaxID=3154928 RepID=UPI0034339244
MQQRLLGQCLDAAATATATAIAALHHDNTLLRQELAASGSRVTPLRPPTTPRNPA